MKKLILGITSFVFIASSFSSCTIQKRLHQDGYHISWKFNHTQPSEKLLKTYEEQSTVLENTSPETNPNFHSVETISANSNQDNDLILTPKKTVLVESSADTIVPDQTKQQEEYFSNNYTNPLPTNELQDTKLANWALGLGIGAVSSPLWVTLLFLLLFALVGATWSGVSVWTALGLAIIAGGGIFITLEVLAITFAIRFLRMHGNDPNYRKYRSRAITGLILAGIYPALILLNIIIGLAVI